MLKKLLVLTCVLAVAGMAAPYVMQVPEGLEAVLHNAPVEADVVGAPVSSGASNNIMAADPEQAGTTTYDYQQNGALGNRVMIDDAGNAHVCWMSSDLEDFSDRAVDYNFWDATSETFFPGGAVQASGVSRAGYTTMGIFSDGRAVVAFHSNDAEGNVWSDVAVDAAPGAGAFGAPVTVDNVTVRPNDGPIWPHIVVGADDVIHVMAHVNDTGPDGDNGWYSRSDDDGASFSNWYQLYTNGGDDPAIAVSSDGSKVCVSWMSPVATEGGGTAFPCGHIYYIESTNSGQSWGSMTKVTEGRYTDLLEDNVDAMWLLANFRNIDCAYDSNDEVVIAWTEGFHTYDASQGFLYYPRLWARMITWFEGSGTFGCPTAYYPMFHSITSEGDTVWEIDSLGLWGVPAVAGEAHGGQYIPQLAKWGDNMVLVFGGQYDSLDLSGGGTVNGDIYGTVTTDDGETWHPLTDYDTMYIGTVWERLTNITSTPSYGAGVGATMDEDYLTVFPSIVDDMVHITYIEDKFSGSVISNPDCPAYLVIEDNPAMYLRYDGDGDGIDVGEPLDTNAIAEDPIVELSVEVASINEGVVNFNIGRPVADGIIKIYDATGALVESLEASSAVVTWDADVSGIYFYNFITPDATTNGKLVLVD